VIGSWQLSSHPVGAGLLYEASGALNSAVVLIFTLVASYFILQYAVGSAASARASATFGIITGAVGMGLVALFGAFDPVSTRLPTRLNSAFNGRITGTRLIDNDARWALSAPEHTPEDPSNKFYSGWGWRARRERLSQIAKAINM
jgi:hypothetical protein